MEQRRKTKLSVLLPLSDKSSKVSYEIFQLKSLKPYRAHPRDGKCFAWSTKLATRKFSVLFFLGSVQGVDSRELSGVGLVLLTKKASTTPKN